MKKTYKSVFILVNLIIIFIIYLINSSLVINSFIDYSILFLTKLFPVSFIFYILAGLMMDYGIVNYFSMIFKNSSTYFYVLLLSIFSGFPSGSKYTKDLLDKNIIKKSDGEKIIQFSHFPNPMFVLGSVSVVLGKELSIIVLISIILSNFIIFLFIKKDNSSYIDNNDYNGDFSYLLSEEIKRSFNILLLIYGTSLFFYLLSAFIVKYITLPIPIFVFINGMFDLTKGVFSCSMIDNYLIRSYFILFFISFGGLSIHMQVKSILADTSISYKYFFIGRVLGTIISFIIFSLIIYFCGYFI